MMKYEDREGAERVPQHRLGGEGDGDTADTQTGNGRGDVDAKAIQDKPSSCGRRRIALDPCGFPVRA
jgi:hypothetical protein